MGKPFKSELEKIKDTICWAEKSDINEFRKFIFNNQNTPLVCIGSGGSFSACHYSTMLYNMHCSISTSITPFILSNYKDIFVENKLLFISASGKNIDINIAFKKALISNIAGMANLSMRKNNPLLNLGSDFSQVLSFNYDLPEKKDGFLATNSLIAFFTILYKVYYDDDDISNKLTSLNGYSFELPQNIDLSKIDNFIVLYGIYGESVAYDIESKLSEAALGSALIADYRNFGHGRHNWFDKKPSNSCIITLISESDELIAEKTLANIPDNIPVICIRTTLDTALASLDLLIKSFEFVKLLGEVRGIDPGRPGIPEYGSKLYHLKYNSLLKTKSKKINIQEIAILRKYRRRSVNSIPDDVYQQYRNAYFTYVSKLNNTNFSMIAFDYDGTLCDIDVKSRYNQRLDERILQYFLSILKNETKIAVISGRGKSVNTILENSIPKEFWHLIYIGNYNGMIVYPLINKKIIESIKDEELNEELKIISTEIQNLNISKIELNINKRRDQLTIVCEDKQFIYELCQEIIINKKLVNLHVWVSSHSMDIVVKSVVTKKNILNFCEGNTLCIGDSGNYTGNDFELLANEFSLSVDKVPLNPFNCWNIAPENCKGIESTLYYLKSLTLDTKGNFKCNFIL